MLIFIATKLWSTAALNVEVGCVLSQRRDWSTRTYWEIDGERRSLWNSSSSRVESHLQYYWCYWRPPIGPASRPALTNMPPTRYYYQHKNNKHMKRAGRKMRWTSTARSGCWLPATLRECVRVTILHYWRRCWGWPTRPHKRTYRLPSRVSRLLDVI